MGAAVAAVAEVELEADLAEALEDDDDDEEEEKEEEEEEEGLVFDCLSEPEDSSGLEVNVFKTIPVDLVMVLHPSLVKQEFGLLKRG